MKSEGNKQKEKKKLRARTESGKLNSILSFESEFPQLVIVKGASFSENLPDFSLYPELSSQEIFRRL